MASDMFTNSKYYFNRELSWLKFNQRVLQEAIDKSNPLMEKLRFLAITASNQDEFFMIRVAGLRHQAENNIVKYDAARMDAKAQLKASLMMSMESTSSRCEQIASQMHIHGRPIEAKEILQKIEAVDTNHIKDIATKVFSSAPTLTTLGPLSEKREAGILRVA